MPYGYYGYDWTYLLLILGMVIASIAQFMVSSTYNKYKGVLNQKGLTGSMVARSILDKAGLYHVNIEMGQGVLSDHYDPNGEVIRLSQDVYNGASLAAVAIASHEVGHAIQHSEGYMPLSFRSMLAPVAGITSQFVWILVMAGIFLSLPFLIDIGIILFSATLLFQIITLPVEFNASRRAIANLADGYVNEDEIPGAKKVLGAAALTYVAATLVSLFQMIRLIGLSNRRRR